MTGNATISPALTVDLGDRGYPIYIAEDALGTVGELISPLLRQQRVITISDDNTSELFLPAVEASLDKAAISHSNITIPAGESSKSFAMLENLMEKILALKPERSLALVALGGGVVGDITGFAASILLRGVDFIQLPTTLLAQVDSSVGGKTGINTSAGKNLVGSFHQPRAVIIDPAALDSLPPRQLLSGYAEVVKYGVLGDADFFSWLEKNGAELLSGNREKQIYAIKRCCALKADIVRRDEKEGAVRALLNLGHTFAHALEAETGYSDELLHGEAVSIGMVLAARLSVAMGLMSDDDAARVTALLAASGLPTTPLDIRNQWSVDNLLQHMRGDKKVKSGVITFILLRTIGDAFASREVQEDILADMLAQELHIS